MDLCSQKIAPLKKFESQKKLVLSHFLLALCILPFFGHSGSTYMSGKDVGINLVHVSMDVMSYHVLVGPNVHRHPCGTVIDGSQELPHPRLVGDGKMTGE